MLRFFFSTVLNEQSNRTTNSVSFQHGVTYFISIWFVLVL